MEHFDRKEWSLAAIGFQNYVQLADQSDWGREKTAQGYWHLAASKFAAGEQQQALESSLAGYYRYPIDEVYANQVLRIAK